ncbi:MAG: putative membrane protein [Maribacter sp.]|jgi:putative membrane protein
MEITSAKEKRFNRMIALVSIVIPLVVAGLFVVKIPNVEPLSFLPPIYASINGLTAVLLIVAVLAIKKGNQRLHQNVMTVNIALSLLFLILYIAYHMTSDSTSYGGEGVMRYVYYFILITHIVLSIAIVPLVLRTYAKAYLKDYEKHRAFAKYTFPIWLYVAVTGVVVYVMISPYYAY